MGIPLLMEQVAHSLLQKIDHFPGFDFLESPPISIGASCAIHHDIAFILAKKPPAPGAGPTCIQKQLGCQDRCGISGMLSWVDSPPLGGSIP
jgi:hypothetical protein